MTARAKSTRMYSWWWDSHISPKNSKWLQENLTDMDSNVKKMIKLIEEDADSFARRAEMYYKKRPELMKLVEEFYRAYRALAERYDHATGVIRQAHTTMAQAFPNQPQCALALGDDSPAGAVADFDPRTPDLPSIRAFRDPDESDKDDLGVSPTQYYTAKASGGFTEEADSVISGKGSRRFNNLFGSGEVGGVRKGLNFDDSREKQRAVKKDNGSADMKVRGSSDSGRMAKAEQEIVTLRNALAKLEGEKEAELLQYQQSMERLTHLQSEVSRAKEGSLSLNERAVKAEAEVQTLKENLSKLEAESETNFLLYQQCQDKICNLEKHVSCAEQNMGELSERASKAETEAHSLKEDLVTLGAEKEAALSQYKQCLERISDLESKLLQAEEDAVTCRKRAEKAEEEVENLREALAKLAEENEATAVRFQQCLDLIQTLEHKLACAEEETRRLNTVIDVGVSKLKGAEEKCSMLQRSNQVMHSDLESLSQKMEAQNDELTEKQKELGRLLISVQEEHLRFVEAETAFQTLQDLHSQSQEELRTLGEDLQNRVQILENLEARNHSLEAEVRQVQLENKNLTEVNFSSALTLQSLNDEMSSLRELIGKLEAEIGLRVDQRNALQQEIYSLKQEMNELNNNHQTIMEQVESVGLRPECLSSYVKDIQNDSAQLKEECERSKTEKLALMEKLEVMGKLMEKNAFLENSLSDLNMELEGARETVKKLEETCQSLLGEKSALVSEKAALISQLETATNNSDKLREDNNTLETSLFGANAELNGLTEKIHSLEALCVSLENQKSELATVKASLNSQLEITRQKMNDLESSCASLEERRLSLENERESMLLELKQLQDCLETGNQEHATLAQRSDSQLAGMTSQIKLLQEEAQCTKKEYEAEFEKAINYQIQIFVLQKCVQDLEENNSSLLIEYQNLLAASRRSAEVISALEDENLEQKEDVKRLSDQLQTLRQGLYRTSKILGLDINLWRNDEGGLLDLVLNSLEETQELLSMMQDDNQQLSIEKSILATLLAGLQVEKVQLGKELGDMIKSKQEEVEVIRARQEKQIVKLSEDFDNRSSCIHGSKIELENELCRLRGELVEMMNRKTDINHELRKAKNGAELWESEAAVFLGELQISSVREGLFECKVHELIEACQSYEERNYSKDKDIKELKERVSRLETENGDLKRKMSAWIPAFVSLMDSISSLELHLSHPTTLGSELQDEESYEQTNEDQSAAMLQEVGKRIRGVETAVMEKERQSMLANSKLEAAMREIDELKSGSRRGSGWRGRRTQSEDGSEVMTKDIILHQDGSMIHMTVGRKTSSSGGSRDRHPSAESLSISRRFSECCSQEANSRKLLEGLESDAQKLAELEMAVQEVRKKVEAEERSRKKKKVGKGIEYDLVKEQLDESEESIVELFDMNRKLVKSIEKESALAMDNDDDDDDDDEKRSGAGERRIAEQARRGSEKIGRLQLEVQKLQYIVMKFEGGEYERKSEERRRVMLRDYLYGVRRASPKREKKSRFCSCMQQPATRGD